MVVLAADGLVGVAALGATLPATVRQMPANIAMVGRGFVNCSESFNIEVANVSKTMAPIRNNYAFII